MGTKVCSACKLEKPLSAYSKNKTRKDGYQHQCKACHSSAQKAYYEANKEQYATWYEANKERLADYNKAYYEANKEREAARKKAYYEANKERQAAYREANKERRAASMKAWQQANPDKVNAKVARRRAFKLQATPSWANSKAISEFYECAFAFKLYTGLEYHVDHIVPLKSKLVCGLHCESNLQVLEARTNLGKGNRWWPDMP